MNNVHYIFKNTFIDDADLVRVNSLYMVNGICTISRPGNGLHIATKDGKPLSCVRHRKAWLETYDYWKREYNKTLGAAL